MYLSAIKCKIQRAKPRKFVPQVFKVQQRYKNIENKPITLQNKPMFECIKKALKIGLIVSLLLVSYSFALWWLLSNT